MKTGRTMLTVVSVGFLLAGVRFALTGRHWMALALYLIACAGLGAFLRFYVMTYRDRQDAARVREHADDPDEGYYEP